jgi:hypothetical protein
MYLKYATPLWMGVRPRADLTRVLVQDGPLTILKARLPEAPAHPRAVETLAEGLALWYGRPICVALGVAAEDAFCALPGWHSTAEGVVRTPLVSMDLVIGRPRPPRGDLRGLGDFDDVRQLRLWEPWERSA